MSTDYDEVDNPECPRCRTGVGMYCQRLDGTVHLRVGGEGQPARVTMPAPSTTTDGPLTITMQCGEGCEVIAKVPTQKMLAPVARLFAAVFGGEEA